jgi:hypothetical protein
MSVSVRFDNGGPTRFDEPRYGFVTPFRWLFGHPVVARSVVFHAARHALPDMFLFIELPDFIIRCFFRIRASEIAIKRLGV